MAARWKSPVSRMRPGRVFGLMPHPERFLFKSHHYDPDWNGDRDHGHGYYFFRSIWREISGGRKLLAETN